MAARAAIKVLDSNIDLTTVIPKSSSATTAEDRTFSPAGTDRNGVAWWEERSGTYRIGFPRFSMSHRAPTKTSRIDRVQAKLELPVLESVAGDDSNGFTPAPVVAYTLTANIEFLLPDRSSVADRTRLMGGLISLLSKTVTASDGSPSSDTGSPLVAQVVNLDDVY